MSAWDRFEDKVASHEGHRVQRASQVTLETYQREDAAHQARAAVSAALASLRNTARFEGGDHSEESKRISREWALAHLQAASS